MTEDKPLIVDLGPAKTAKEFHTILAEALKFPGYYGKNWDAFNDVVMDAEGHEIELPEKAYFTGWNDVSAALPREVRLFEKCVVDLIEWKNVYWRFVDSIIGRQPTGEDPQNIVHDCWRDDCQVKRRESGELYWARTVCGHGDWPCGACRYPVHAAGDCPGHTVLDELAEL